MPEKTEYAAGMPSWTDLTTNDVDASATFYGTLFGWVADRIDDPAAGGYTMLSHNGRTVAALGPLQSPEQPTRWQCYVSVDDVDKTCEIAQSAGGTVAVPAMDVLDAGRMAVLQDPTGAFISAWQAGTMKGAALMDEPVSLSWIELSTRDPEQAKAFYAEVFGWGEHTSDGEMPYTEFKVGDTSVAGMMRTPDEMPAEVPAYWMPYFQVADIERTTREAGALGANVMVPPSPIPGERMLFAVLADPAGAAFGLLQNTTPATDA
jgi:predicted enzyme related to lactoylglutathione lyase